jgi:type I restriction enzyme M protein
MKSNAERVGFIWSVADLLRGTYKQSQYGKVMLPFVVLRRLDCVLEPTKSAVLAEMARSSVTIDNLDQLLCKAAGQLFYNTSSLNFSRILGDPENVAGNLRAYIAAFSPAAAEVIEKFSFDIEITKLTASGLLYQVMGKFNEVDLHPDQVSNHDMGYIYEELIRKFSELSNETAGEHFTPREVIRLMVNLLFANDDKALAEPGVVRTLYDPACGTGGMLSVAEDYLREFNSKAGLVVFGQEKNDETYAICRSDMMIKGQDPGNIYFGNSFIDDGSEGRRFDYMLSNPPFGVEWKDAESIIKSESQVMGFSGRFGAGLPRINDGSFLFLQHMISKMKPVSEGGSRIAIVFNGSPLFTGGAGSGESEIRRWIIENDWLDAVVALPDQLFYNTGISIYIWIISNRKVAERKGKIQLIDARDFFTKMRKSLGDKRKEPSEEHITEISQIYADFAENKFSKIFANEFFGHQRVTVERPLQLRYEVTRNAIDGLAATKVWEKLTADEQSQVTELLRSLLGASTTERGAMKSKLAGVPKTIEKTIWDLISVHDENAPVIMKKGQPEPDPELRDYENIALPRLAVQWEQDLTGRLGSTEYQASIADYIEREVLPWVPDAWVDHTKTKVGYEIPLTRQFYTYAPPRPLAEIDAEIDAINREIQELLDRR